MFSTQVSLKNTAMKMVFWQIFAVILLAAGICLFANVHSGLSALLGGCAYCLPNLFFVRRVFDATTARAAKQFVLRFGVAEVAKLISSAIIFVLLVKFTAVVVLPALGGYIIAIMSFWVISMVFMLREGSANP